ncbi:MAG: hypothetical protein LPH21_12625 [Shewanella sp.]|nr:hypothetical protein [Shewanella sp.]
MRKAFITLIAASSMMTGPGMAIEACQTVLFITEERKIVPENVICRKGFYRTLSPQHIRLLEPPGGGGFISCRIPVIDGYGRIDVYGVTKIACHQSNPEFANVLDLYYNSKDRIVDPDFNLQALVTNENGVKIVFVK